MAQVITLAAVERATKGTASKKVQTLSIAPLLAEAIMRISQERSVSSLFG